MVSGRGQISKIEPIWDTSFTARGSPFAPEYKDFAYAELGDILEEAASAAGVSLFPDTHVIVRHYVDLLRSEFMENSEGVAVAWKIWMQHSDAIEFVRKNSPPAQIRAELKRLLYLTPLCEYQKRKGRERLDELAFALRGWRQHPELGDPTNSNFTGR